MKNKQIADLKKWLKEPENNLTQVAAALGYSSPNTIKQWIENDHVQPYMKRQLEVFLNARKR